MNLLELEILHATRTTFLAPPEGCLLGPWALTSVLLPGMFINHMGIFRSIYLIPHTRKKHGLGRFGQIIGPSAMCIFQWGAILVICNFLRKNYAQIY